MAVPRRKLKKTKMSASSNKQRRPKLPPGEKVRTGADLMKHWGAWVGDDIDELLKEAIASRSRARF
ncbi:MAG: hypothetical protein K2X29_05770 [Candidatus Obscuribacterales bacterium]|nr:hypothetical protein [Candidatus Obscuribacterales bacterium]